MRVSYPKGMREQAEKEGTGLFCVDVIWSGVRTTHYGPLSDIEIMRALREAACNAVESEPVSTNSGKGEGS